MDQIKIGIFIAEQRKKKSLTQEQLAEKLGISKNAVSKWERGISFPDVSLYKVLCSELDISIEELINGEKNNSDEAFEKAIIKTINEKEKIKRKNIKILIILSLIILMLLFGILLVYNKGKKDSDYYERNIQKTYLARDVDALLKYRNEGKYPDYYGGMYISDDSYFLVLQIVKDNIPSKGERDYMYYNELIAKSSEIKIEYVKNSYNELEEVYNKINEYFINNTLFDDLNSWGIDILNNSVTVGYTEINDDIIKNFKNNVVDSDVLRFEAVSVNDDYNKCLNYVENLGDDILEKEGVDFLIAIEDNTVSGIPVSLVIYDDGTYELFTAYKACKPGKNCNLMLIYTKSLKGTYDYDIRKLVDSIVKTKVSKNEKRGYRITIGKWASEYEEAEYNIKISKNRYLEELLKQLDIDLKKCAKPLYN